MMEDNITKRKIYTESKISEIVVMVRLWLPTLKCQDVLKYNFAK